TQKVANLSQLVRVLARANSNKLLEIWTARICNRLLQKSLSLVPKLRFGNALSAKLRFALQPVQGPKLEFRKRAFPNRSLATRGADAERERRRADPSKSQGLRA